MLEGKAILLIYKGAVQQHNLDEADITLDELEAAVREHGVMDIQKVDIAMLEVDGNISVISDDFKERSTVSVPAMQNRRRHKLRGRVTKS